MRRLARGWHRPQHAVHIARHHSAQAETEGYRATLQLALDSPKGVAVGVSSGVLGTPPKGLSAASIVPG